MVMRKTTVCIDEELLESAVKISGAKSKKEAIEKSLRLLVKSKKREIFSEELGTYDLDLAPKKLEHLRNEG
jgi:Arc/MetJ family transcription regulator